MVGVKLNSAQSIFASLSTYVYVQYLEKKLFTAHKENTFDYRIANTNGGSAAAPQRLMEKSTGICNKFGAQVHYSHLDLLYVSEQKQQNANSFLHHLNLPPRNLSSPSEAMVTK